MDFIFDPSLVLYLPLYELDGTSFMSEDKHGHLCTVTGALWRPNGHYFDGTDDIITCGNNAALDLTSEGTIEWWAKWDGETNKFFDLVKGASGTEALNNYFVGGLGGYRAGIGNGSTRNQIIADASTILNGTFQHWVFRWDGSYLKLFADCIEVKSGSQTINGVAVSDILKIGHTEPQATRFNGIGGELRIYSRALTPLEIQRNYLATKWRYR